MVDVAFGLIAALCWGVADFLAKQWGERYGVLTAVLFQHVFSVLALLPFLPLVPSLEGALMRAALAAVAVGLVSPVAYWLLYSSLATGKLSINSPVASSGAAFSVLLSLLILRERPGGIAIVGMAVLISGVMLINFRLEEGSDRVVWKLSQSIVKALGAAVLLGLLNFLIPVMLKPLGAIGAVLLVRFSGSVLLIAVKRLDGRALPALQAKIWTPLLLLSVLDAVGFLAYFVSTTANFVSIGAALSGAFAAVSAVLGWVILRERATLLQHLSVVMIVAGVVTLSLP